MFINTRSTHTSVKENIIQKGFDVSMQSWLLFLSVLTYSAHYFSAWCADFSYIDDFIKSAQTDSGCLSLEHWTEACGMCVWWEVMAGCGMVWKKCLNWWLHFGCAFLCSPFQTRTETFKLSDIISHQTLSPWPSSSTFPLPYLFLLPVVT